MKPEEKARQMIDGLLEAAGWKVQNLRELNLSASLGVAVREFPLKSGPADYLLFVDRKAAGVVEAKPEGTTLSGVAEQSEAYLYGVPKDLPHVYEPLPFAYESTGIETFFRTSNTLDPVSRVCITTIQRLYSMLKGEPEFDESVEEGSMFEMVGANGRSPLQVSRIFQPEPCNGIQP